MGDRLGMCGGDSVCVMVSFKYSFIGSESFTCVLVGVNAGEEGLKCVCLVSVCFLCRYLR